MLISPHFSYIELTRSDYALRHSIDNTPPPEAASNLTRLCNSVLERIRGYVANNHPLHVTSGYRCPALNLAIGGSPTSQHMRGEAADFVVPSMRNRAVMLAILNDSHILFDQIILEGKEEEGGWLHISFSQRLRHEALTATFTAGKVTYSPFV